MSDGFQPASTGPTPKPAPSSSVNLSADVVMHLTAIAEDIAAGFRHLAAVLPTTAPLAALAANIKDRVAEVHAIVAPPEKAPPPAEEKPKDE